MRKSAYSLLCLAISFGGTFDFGYISCYVNTAELEFREFLNKTSIQRWSNQPIAPETSDWIWSVILNIYFVGYIIGVLLLPKLAESLGRVVTIRVGSFISIVGTVLGVIGIPFYIPEMLALSRLVVGVANGLTMNTLLIFIQETSPTSIRGFTSSLFEVLVCFNGLVGTVCGLPQLFGKELSILVGLGAIPNCLTILITLFLPETPKHLFLVTGSPSQARDSIKFYQGTGRFMEVDLILDEIQEEGAVEKGTQDISLLSFLRVPYLRKSLTISIVALVAQQATGIVAIFFFTTFFFTQVGLEPEEAQIGTVLLLLVNTVFVIVGSIVVERVGRRPLLLWTELGIIVSLIAYLVSSVLYHRFQIMALGYACLGIMFIYIVIFSLGPGPVPWFITAELVPQHARSYAMCLGQVVNNVAILVLSLLLLPLYGLIGTYSFLILYIIPSSLCALYLYFYLPETRNREISDIVSDMQKNS